MRLTEEEIQVARVSEKKLRLTAVRETEVKWTRCQFLSTQLAKFETIHISQRAGSIGEMGILSVASVGVNCCPYFPKLFGRSYKISDVYSLWLKH